MTGNDIRTRFARAKAMQRIRAQYAENAKQIHEIAASARLSGRPKYRGETADYWQEKANEYTAMARGELPFPWERK